jgi:hypothetical protein
MNSNYVFCIFPGLSSKVALTRYKKHYQV